MAHNHEVARSKRVSGILLFAKLYRSSPSMLCDVKLMQNTLTGMAQRQRAGLITPRSLDRNGLPVFSYSRSFIVLPHNPPASSWGDQKLAVPLDVKHA